MKPPQVQPLFWLRYFRLFFPNIFDMFWSWKYQATHKKCFSEWEMTAGGGRNFKLKCLCFFLETFVETLLPLFRILFLDYVCFGWLVLGYVCGWDFFFHLFQIIEPFVSVLYPNCIKAFLKLNIWNEAQEEEVNSLMSQFSVISRMGNPYFYWVVMKCWILRSQLGLSLFFLKGKHFSLMTLCWGTGELVSFDNLQLFWISSLYRM